MHGMRSVLIFRWFNDLCLCVNSPRPLEGVCAMVCASNESLLPPSGDRQLSQEHSSCRHSSAPSASIDASAWKASGRRFRWQSVTDGNRFTPRWEAPPGCNCGQRRLRCICILILSLVPLSLAKVRRAMVRRVVSTRFCAIHQKYGAGWRRQPRWRRLDSG